MGWNREQRHREMKDRRNHAVFAEGLTIAARLTVPVSFPHHASRAAIRAARNGPQNLHPKPSLPQPPHFPMILWATSPSTHHGMKKLQVLPRDF
ncbi:hypothetical protein [Bifidobacterium boum]|uniref:hypothetical protein n=1 Tax=Bifidobacterium boum TaxID=78343 RepID=UPI00242A96D0|nr:hypothetical protein [Bifidobacterium boum]MCI5861122.1 hypothetical protein [Bifidobacterium boum]